jgi:multidrug efflux pump
VTEILTADPAIEGVATSIAAGGGPGSSQSNEARFFVSLKPIGERKDSAAAVIARLRQKFAAIKGVDIFMFPGQEIMFGGRQSRSQYQVTLWGPDLKEIAEWLPKAQAAMKRIPGVIDVNSDREAGGPQATVTIDRVKAAKFGVSVADVNSALNNAFSQRAVSTVYTLRTQYNVILEADPAIQRSLQGLDSIYVKGSASQQVPLSSVATITMTQTPLSMRHTGQFPSATVSFNLSPGVALGPVIPKIIEAGRDLGLPEQLHFELSGETLAQQAQSSSTLLLIVAALVTVYLVLGILYEDLVHPLTILSTLPSAGFGALLVMHAAGETLSIISLIGIILLIGLVKKNGIMLVDFALDAERRLGLSSEDAIRRACIERFRPILMTTLAAMFGALPLVFASGPGSELRTPLGLTIVGGLAVSQLLTIYTTPVIYLWLDKLRWRKRRAAREAKAAAQPQAT